MMVIHSGVLVMTRPSDPFGQEGEGGEISLKCGILFANLTKVL